MNDTYFIGLVVKNTSKEKKDKKKGLGIGSLRMKTCIKL